MGAARGSRISVAVTSSNDDWRDHPPEAFLARTGREVPFLRTANHYFLSASISHDPDAPLGRIVGDLLVLRSSAWAHEGRGQKLKFPVERYAHATGVNHLDLLNHPAIYEQIRSWCREPPALPQPVLQLAAGNTEAGASSATCRGGV